MKKSIIFSLFIIMIMPSLVYAGRVDVALKHLKSGNASKAIRMLKKEDKRKSASAAFYLGRIYELGLGVKTSTKDAAKYYKKSAVRGHAKAMNRYGVMRINGIGILQNYADGLDYICKSANKDELAGIFNCASLYYDGKGVKQNIPKALVLLEKATKRKHVGAINMLGLYYLGDKDKTKVDFIKAAEYFKQSADIGNTLGMFEYATILSLKKSGMQDLIKAHTYFNLAAAKGHVDAAKARDKLARKMSADDIALAHKNAEQWHALQKNTFITVRTFHNNDRVYIDGNYVGASGIKKHKLTSGKHTILIKKNGYKEKEIKIELEAGKSIRLPAKGKYKLKRI